MKKLQWFLILLSVFLITTCGSDDGINQNPNDPGNNPEQTNNPVLDSDEDGVSDDDDQCPDTPSDEQTDENGCSPSQLDSDNDGVHDDIDECPDTPDGAEVDDQGCSDSQKDDDEDGVSNADDQCPDTATGATVNEEGCSDAQSDSSPPGVTSIDITEIAPTFFKVDWRIDEGSKGYIRFGTSSGNYTDSTAIEERYLDRHRQTVGAENPVPLTPNTTYYWQIYVEDEYGNSGYWEEQVTTTSDEVQGEKTYVPDDGFEQTLIDLGHDNTLDDYVLTKNIENIEELILRGRPFAPIFMENLIGIHDFISLKTLRLHYITGIINFNLHEAPALEDLRLTDVTISAPYTITNYPQLKKLSIYGDQLHLLPYLVNQNDQLESCYLKGQGETIITSDNPILDVLFVEGIVSKIEINNNQQLKRIITRGSPVKTSHFGTLKIQNNPSLEAMNMSAAEFEGIELSEIQNVERLDARNLLFNFSMIDLTEFIALKQLLISNASYQHLPELNISQNSNLEYLNLRYTEFNALDVAGNTKLESFALYYHKVQCIQVNQEQLDAIPNNWNVSPEVPYALNCN